MESAPHPDTTRAILYWISQGEPIPDVLQKHELTDEDLRAAASEALTALETQGSARVESRQERIERLRVTYPNAYSPWTKDEDRELLREFRAGASLAALGRAFGRQSNAIRARLEKLLGADWREKR